MWAEDLFALAWSECPDCGNSLFRPGPRGGLSQNIECIQCLNRFNVAHYNGHLFHAERITREDQGGTHWREDLFPQVLQ